MTTPIPFYYQLRYQLVCINTYLFLLFITLKNMTHIEWHLKLRTPVRFVKKLWFIPNLMFYLTVLNQQETDLE